MNGKRLVVAALAAILTTSTSLAAGELILAAKGVAAREGAVTLAADATESQRFAAEELAAYAKRITGAGLSARVVIERPEPSLGLGEEGFRLYVKGGALHIAGGTRGAIYGVYELLERFGGCGWYTPTTEVVPAAARFAVPDDLDLTEKPTFALRETSWSDFTRHPTHALHLRINARTTPPIEARRGGVAYRFAKGTSQGHTFLHQLPSSVYYKDHPEYFSYRDGKRRGGNESQICLTNPDVLRIVTESVLKSLAEDPGANMVGVSQNDNQRYCDCEKCHAIAEEEGCYTGVHLRFVNAIAEAVEKVRPDVLVETLIYQYTRPLPKITRPRANVVPCLCAIECRRHVPLADETCPPNAKFMKDLRDWGRVSKNLLIWDYTTNYRNLIYPMPIEGILAANLKTFRDNRANFMFPEGSGSSTCNEFSHLKAYLLAKLMWNPDQDLTALLDRYFAGAYGAAAPHVRAYYDRTRAEAARTKESFGIFNAEPPKWYTREFSAWARETFDKAVAAVQDDPIRLANVREAEATPIVIELDRNAKDAKTFYVTRQPERFATFEGQAADYRHILELMAAAKKAGEPMRLAAGLCWEPCKLRDWARTYGGTVDRAARDEGEFGSGSFFIVSGRHVKSTPEATGLDGAALRILPSHAGMMTKLAFRNVAFDPEAEYEIAFRYKVEKDGPQAAGEAFQAELGATGSGEVANLGEAEASGASYQTVYRTVAEVSDDWEWYVFKPMRLKENFVFSLGSGRWAKGGGVGATKGVLLDRIRIRRVQTEADRQGPVTQMAPAAGETVPLLSPEQRAFLKMSALDRLNYFDDRQKAKEKEIESWTDRPRPVRLSWRGGRAPYRVAVRRRGDGAKVHSASVTNRSHAVWNLEVGREYEWAVCDASGSKFHSSFRTEDLAPRLIRVDGDGKKLRGVPNMRDIGGRVMADGRRVRQGLVYRSAGLNNNAQTIFYTLDEVLNLEKEGKLAGMGDLGAKYSRHLKEGRKLDPACLRLIKRLPTKPGTPRLTAAARAYLTETLGIKTDIDLRSTRERTGLTESPLGPQVKFVCDWENYHGYGAVHNKGLEATKKIFRLMLDRANYPLVFHCIGGADRTGTVATLLHGILGASDNDIWLDYQITGWHGGVNNSRRISWFTSFVRSFDTFRGATLSARICDYFRTTCGFTEAELETIRDILLEPAEKEVAADLVIYGGTPAGLAAAVQAKRMGLSAVLLEPTLKLGGLTTGGLGQTDIGNKAAFGGLARQFYRDIKAHYERAGAWRQQARADYKPRGQSVWVTGEDSMWTFEPSAASAVVTDWVVQNGLDVRLGKRLDRRAGGVTKEGAKIVAIRMEDGQVYRGRMFLDCTYEGDLLAAAGVSYAVGREDNRVYGETISGIQRGRMRNHQLAAGVDPYVEKGKPASGLLPGIERDCAAADGSGDRRVQAYCYRMCLTDDPTNRIAFAKPAGYRAQDYELLLRNLEAGGAGAADGPHGGMPWINSPMPNRKTDTNNRTGFSTDFIGANWNYPEASYAEREQIAARHLAYQQGLMWTLANDPRVPARIRREVARWGTCKDEFVGERGDGWQLQLYVREARRLVGEYVMTEHNCRGEVAAPHPVALGAYGMDSHNVRRYVGADGFAHNEGNIEDYRLTPPGKELPAGTVNRFPPYGIDYGALVPKRGECANLLVPVCLSASHMAFGSIRMEPVFFALGQVAATAAAQAIAANVAVQDVPYAPLRTRLVADGVRIAW